jgi:hypothetical protein
MMNSAQNRLIVASLCCIAAVSHVYCLEYRSTDYWTSHGRIFDSRLALPAAPVIALSETVVTPPTETGAGVVNLTGLYPRHGLTFQAAALGGLLAPIILLLVAGYIALGARMPSLPRRNLIDEVVLTRPPVPPSDATGCNGGGATEVDTPTDFNAVESPAPTTVQPRTYRGLYRMAAIAGVIALSFGSLICRRCCS